MTMILKLLGTGLESDEQVAAARLRRTVTIHVAVGDDGHINYARIDVAVDCTLVVHRDGVRAPIENTTADYIDVLSPSAR
jgi:hypothetical protein